MSRRIKLSRRSVRNLETLLDYLKSNWSLEVKNNFIKKLDSGLLHLGRFPESHPESDVKKGLHKYVLTKQTTIYYKFNTSSLLVVALFDTRQHPQKIKGETK